MSKSNKPTKEEMTKRFLEIIAKMNQGVSRRQIVLDYMQQYKVNEGVAYNAFSRAMQLLSEDQGAYRDYLRDVQLSRYEALIEAAYNKNDLKTVNAILANIDKLFSLSTVKVEQSGEIKIVFE